ncbi:hypothetical protein [Saccharopolyspora taberi]|uniref:Uncharacterized protein n=1 Tax=Saccharopolyspora taberi TaxID=60895 RepID=A0ABN3VR14_9PSEU
MTNPYQQQPPYPPRPPHPGFAPPGPPMPPPKKSRTGLIVTLCVAGVLVLALVVVSAVVLVQAPGGREPSAAEPQPLTSLPISPGSGPVPVYGGTRAPNVCSIVPVDLLKSQGWQLSPEETITERLPDPDHPAPQPVAQQPGGLLTGLSGCSVLFEQDAQVSFSVDAAPISDPGSMESDLRIAREHGSTSTTEGKWEILLDEENPGTPEGAYGYLTDRTSVVEFSIVSPTGTPHAKAVDVAKQALSEMIAKWDSAYAGASAGKYPAPFGEVPDPCAAIEPGDIDEVFHLQHSGVVDRTWSSSPVEVFKRGDNERIVYAESTCHQGSVAPRDDISARTGSIDVTLRTFPDAGKAAEQVEFYADPNSEISTTFGPATPLDASIGDGRAYLSPAFAKEHSIMFHVGRYVVSLAATEDSQLFDDEALRARLVPVAQQVAERLR